MKDDPEEVHDRHHEELDIKRQKVNYGEARDDGTPALDCAAKKKRGANQTINIEKKNERDVMQKNRMGSVNPNPVGPRAVINLINVLLVSYPEKKWRTQKQRTLFDTHLG